MRPIAFGARRVMRSQVQCLKKRKGLFPTGGTPLEVVLVPLRGLFMGGSGGTSVLETAEGVCVNDL